MNNKLLIAQLVATRDTLLATVSQVEASLVALDVDPATGEPGVCEHPEEAIVDHSTLGQPPGPFTCTACGVTQDTPFHPSGD